MAPLKIKIKTRDYIMVRVINGVTKAAVHKDKRKEINRRNCRDWRKNESFCD